MAYTKNELNQREEIIQSQKIFWSFLDSAMVNNLVHLFDDTARTPNKISKYIESERKLRGMNDASIIASLYGENKQNTTLIIKIKIKNKPLLHITFHLSPYSLNAEKTGAIHIYKNVYKKYKSINDKRNIYSLIRVNKPIDKLHSLEFSIADGYKTPGINSDEKELQQEMDVIIHIINRLFDEYDPYYIGVKEEVININPRSINVVHNIGKSRLVSLKNKGTGMISIMNGNIPKLPVFYNKYHKTPKKRATSPKPRNISRKVPANKPKID